MKKRTDILFLMPSLLGFAVFFIVPFAYIFYYAFTESAFSDEFVWFDNFLALLKNEFFRLAMKNMLKFTVAAVPLVMVLSVIIAMLIARYAAKLPMVKTAFFLPVILPSAVIVMLWNAYFSGFTPFSSLLLIYLCPPHTSVATTTTYIASNLFSCLSASFYSKSLPGNHEVLNF